jgi:hypothetical protein
MRLRLDIRLEGGGLLDKCKRVHAAKAMQILPVLYTVCCMACMAKFRDGFHSSRLVCKTHLVVVAFMSHAKNSLEGARGGDPGGRRTLPFNQDSMVDPTAVSGNRHLLF